MATADHFTQTGTVSRDPSHRTWFVAAIVVLLVLAVVFGALWLIERADASATETDLTAAEQSVEGLEGTLNAAQGEIAALKAEVTALDTASPVPHEAQAEVQALYEEFMVALRDPKAAEISAMFTPAAIHINAYGQEMIGAEAIGEGLESYGPLIVDDPGELIVNGNADGSMVAAMTGTVGGVEGLLVTRIANWDGEPNFSHMIWFGR